jgi:hypothetical protein
VEAKIKPMADCSNSCFGSIHGGFGRLYRKRSHLYRTKVASFPFPLPWSKLQLQGKLHRPRPTLLILRANRSETLIEHLCRLPESRIRKERVHVSEVRMVEHVESLCTKLQVNSFM